MSGPDPGAGDAALSTTDYELILKNIHDAVYTLDPNGRITWVNEVAVEEFDGGYTREELIGAPVTKILPAEDVERCVEIITELLETDASGSRRCEISLQTASGREIPCDLHLSLLPSDDGSFEGTLGVVRDVTERKRREQGLSVLNRVLRHNVRNQLNIVMTRAELLEDRPSGDGDDPVETIHDAAGRLLRLSEKARQIESALTGDDGYLGPVDVVDVVEGRLDAFRERYPGARLSLSAPPERWVTANRTLEIVVDNLLENAIQHSDRDAPTVEISIDPDAGLGRWVTVHIADDGPGLPRAELDALEADEETQLVHGSGLGLWLVRWLVDSVGGDVAFENGSPRGSAVSIRLRGSAPPDGG